jgi:peptidoglycan/xylan/chitin deacetylase (PgdA/CDA1 family)
VIGAASLLAVGGIAESIRLLIGGGGRATVATPPGLSRSVTSLLEGSSSSTSGSLPSPNASTSPLSHPTPTHHAAVPHAHSHSHGTHHVHPDHAAHETKAQRAARLRRERVTLPPAQLNVRERPAYRVDQLIPDPPTRALALTIDDGPDPEYTPTVLRLLDKYNTQASFCVIGEHADAYPNLIKDIARAGHILVNHSYTHVQPFHTLSQKRIVWEITKTQQTIEQATGVTPRLFRAPGGDWSDFIFRAVAAYGLEPLDWDVDPRDWAMPGTKRIERRMLRAQPGEIVLCHDGGGNRTETIRALRKVLPTWQRKGIVTIPLSVAPHWLPGADPSAQTTPTPYSPA